MHKLSRALIWLALASLLFAACGQDSDDSSSGEPTAGVAEERSGADQARTAASAAPEPMLDDMDAPATTTQAAAPGDQGSVDANQSVVLEDLDNFGRDFIRTGEVSIAVDNVSDAGREAKRVVAGLGGFVSAENTSSEGADRSVITFRVPPANFQRALDQLGLIGDLRNQTVSTEDVTGTVNNIEAAIRRLEISIERIGGYLAAARDLDEVARLEQQLLQRETELEQLRGQQRGVADLVGLSTVTLTITAIVPGPEIDVVQTAYVGHDGGASCQGEERLTLDEGEPFTMCLAITNRGDTGLTNFAVVDDGFDIDAADVSFIDGSAQTVLAPGERLIAFFETEAGSVSTGLRTGVTAKPVDAETGADLDEPRVGARGDALLDVREDTSGPGFMDSFDKGVSVLEVFIAVVVAISGFLLPFIWVPVLLWLAWRALGRFLLSRPVPLSESRPLYDDDPESTLPPPVDPAGDPIE
ncbi:MAG: DUF4349 domain-containing protein [Acidimicrobiales bacterium]|nr:DUF4349 domain-containing protein [Acidimicrobiales bacterium]